jgi:hypothetical protein
MRSFLLCLLSGLGFALSGQNVTGKVVDNENKPLEYASVVLLDAKDSTMMEFALTDGNGAFSIATKATKPAIIQVTFLGYSTINKAIDLATERTLEPIVMQVSNNQLETIEITEFLNPMNFGKDTVQYNTKAFKINQGDMVEDLLKKLPGIEVERDGSVKALGEKVQNVLVNGKEFFGKDTKIATKNIDAEIVDKVQVFDRKSDKADFTGIDDGQRERSINLKLKKDRTIGAFGTLEGGVGTDGRFKGRGNLNKFSNNIRTSFIGMANNINEQNFSLTDYMDFMGGIGALMGGMSNQNSGIPINMLANRGIQRTFSGGLNVNTNLGSKTELTGSIFGNKYNNFTALNSRRENLVPGSRFSTQSVSDQNSANDVLNYTLRMETKLDSSQMLVLKSTGMLSTNNLESVSSSTSLNANQSKINESNGDRTTSGDGYNFGLDLLYQKSFRKGGRNYSLQGMVNSTNNDNLTDINTLNTILAPMNSTTRIVQNQIGDNNGTFYNLQGTYTEPLTKKTYLEFKSAVSTQNNRTLTDYFDLVNNNPIRNNILSTLYNRDYLQYNNGLSFIFNNKDINSNFGLRYKSSRLNGAVNSETVNVTRPFKALLPNAFARLQLGTSEFFTVNMNADLVEPSLQQLQPIVNNANPLSIFVGNPDLSAEYATRAGLQYSKYDAFNFRMYNASFSMNYTDEKIVEALSFNNALVRTYKPVNVNYDVTSTGRVEFETPIKPLKIKTRSILRGNLNQGFAVINDLETKTNRIGHGYTFSVENRQKEIVDLMVGYRFNKTVSRFANNEMQNQTYSDQSIFSELTIDFKGKFTIKSNLDYNVIKQSFESTTTSFPLWTMSATAFVTKNKKLRATLSCFDLLNKNVGINNSANLNYSNFTRTNVLNRYVMLSLAYNLKGFKKQSGIVINTNGSKD